MTYDKIKALEASIIEVIKKHDCDPSELTKFAEECFIAHRVRGVNENTIKNYQSWIANKEREIARHKTCINNLRGYIDYLEKETENLEREQE
jgi:hypothetical protein